MLRSRELVPPAKSAVKNVFHVKHWRSKSPVSSKQATVNDLFTNTEIAEDDVQDIFHINPAGELAERRGGPAQVLGD